MVSLEEHFAGKYSSSEIRASLSISTTVLSYYCRKRNISRYTHVWVKNIGYVLKKQPSFWQAYAEKAKVTSQAEVSQFLGLSECTLRRIFRLNGITKLTSQQATQKARSSFSHKYQKSSPFGVPSFRRKSLTTLQQRFGQNFSKVLSQKREWFHKKRLHEKTTRLLEFWAQAGYSLLDTYRGAHEALDSGQKTWVQYNFRHTCGHVFKHNTQTCPICPKCFPGHNYRSKLELLYEEMLKKWGEHPCHGRGKIVWGHHRYADIDIFLPSRSIGFEVNGLYWHALTGKPTSSVHSKTYHQDKTISALTQGIRVYHIWEHYRQDIVTSKMKLLLHLITLKKNARSLTLHHEDTDSLREFFDENHLHGGVKAEWGVSLRSQDTIEAALTLRQHKEGLEIARLASRLNQVVRGGFGRLLAQAKIYAKSQGVSYLVSYADRDWSPDPRRTVYASAGFDFVEDTGPSMWYTNFHQVWPRQFFQKHKLQSLFPDVFDPQLSEQDILALKGIFPFYNSGNLYFRLDLSE